MDSISGYGIDVLKSQIFDRLQSFTALEIRQRISLMQRRIALNTKPIFLAFGENCAPAIKLAQAGLRPIGSSYFDNLVVPIESIVEILDADFAGMLQLSNLVIGRWEDQDSVFNDRYSVFFHHYFLPHFRKFEKDDLSTGVRRRKIEDADIPLFMPEVMAQFDYLHIKLKFVLQNDAVKYLVVRRVSGDPVDAVLSTKLRDALDRYGARNCVLRVVHSVQIDGKDVDCDIHRYIPEDIEDGGRWGAAERWRSLLGQN